jgi:hypothetical protein
MNATEACSITVLRNRRLCYTLHSLSWIGAIGQVTPNPIFGELWKVPETASARFGGVI